MENIAKYKQHPYLIIKRWYADKKIQYELIGTPALLQILNAVTSEDKTTKTVRVCGSVDIQRNLIKDGAITCVTSYQQVLFDVDFLKTGTMTFAIKQFEEAQMFEIHMSRLSQTIRRLNYYAKR